MKISARTMVQAVSIPRRALLALGLITVALVVNWPSATGLWAYWLGAGTTRYGVLIAILSLWLVLRSRNALAAAPMMPMPWALPALVVVAAGSMLFWRAGIESLQLALLPLLLLIAVLAALGTRIARIVAFPLGFLYFAMPGWGLLAPTLQLVTIRAVSVIAALAALPAQFAGDLVTLPGIAVFEIGLKCSGVEFLVVGLAVAALIGELEGASLKRRAWLMTLMGTIALVSNWIRVFLIIVIGYATHMRNPFATSRHLLFGWIIFAVALLLFLWVLPRRTPAASESASAETDSETPHARRAIGRSVGAAVAALVLIPAWVYGMALSEKANGSDARIVIPQARAPWRGPFTTADPLWRPRFVGAQIERQFTYEGPGGRSVEVAMVGYAHQEQGRELVNEENTLVGKGGLSAIAYGVAAAGGQRFLQLTAEDAAGHRSLIWWMYDIGGRRFATSIYSQLWYGLEALFRPPYSALYAFRASCQPSCAEAHATLRSFVERDGGLPLIVARKSREQPVRSHTS